MDKVPTTTNAPLTRLKRVDGGNLEPLLRPAVLGRARRLLGAGRLQQLLE